MSPLLNLAALQFEIAWEQPAENRLRVEQECDLLKPGVHLVILPEMFTTGFSMQPERIAEPENGETLKWALSLSRKLDAAIVASWAVAQNGQFYNRLHFVTPLGTVQTYDKRHLFRMAGEDKAFQPGSKPLVVEWLGWRIHLQICYDLRFPVWARNQLKQGTGYDLFVNVANWPAVRSHHWRALLQARAIENQAYVMGLNRVGVDGQQIAYTGESLLFDPQGNLLADVGNKPGWLTATLDSQTLLAWRGRFPAWQDADSFQLV